MNFSNLPGLPPGYVPIAPRRPEGYPSPPVRLNRIAGDASQLSPTNGDSATTAIGIATAFFAATAMILALRAIQDDEESDR